MPRDAPRWPERAAAVLGKRAVRSAVAAAWSASAVAGLLAASSFKAALKSEVPPCRGTASFDAQAAFDAYFPDQPVNGAVFVESADGSPLLGFEPRSTCRAVHEPVDIRGRVIVLRLRCASSSALGGGCATKEDLTAAMRAVAADLEAALRQHMPPSDARRAGEELMLAFLTSPFSALLPDSCPVPSAGSVTGDWLGFMASLGASFRSELGQFHNVAESMADIPPQTVALSSRLPGLSPEAGNWTLNVSMALPAGEFWGTFRDRFTAGSLAKSLTATLHTSRDGVKLSPVGEEATRIGEVLTDIARGAPASLRVRALSLALIGGAVFEGVDRTMRLSAMTVPVALLILAAMVRNLRLVLVTMVNLAACYSSATLIMCPVARCYTTASTAPALMVAVALAMSIDYSLFLLTRFQKEVASGGGVEPAVAVMLATSGRIVLVSGLTLLLCFLMMLCLPVAFIASMGISAAITVLMAVLAALTLTPVLLLSCPSFFGSSERCGLSCQGCCGRRSGRAVAPGRGQLLAGGAPPELGRAAEAPGEACSGKPSAWSRFGERVQRSAWVFVALLLAVAVPVAAPSLPRFRHAIGFEPMMPVDAEVTRTLHELQDAFGVGAVFPTTLLAVPPEGATASAAGLELWLGDACAALKAIAAATDAGRSPAAPAFTPSAFSGAMMLDGQCTGSALAGGPDQWSHVGGPHSATKVMISYAENPFSIQGQQWVQRLRAAVSAPSARLAATWHVLGVAPIEMDVANETFQRLPLMIALMMVAVFGVIAASTRSAVAPLRAALCLSWMLAMTLGLAVLTFQDGLLAGLHWPRLAPRASGAMSWMSPCMAISVLVGLGLDYDIFYSERVIEEWKLGHSERVAAVRALAATANTISAAGLIMVVAFVALLLCTLPSLNEIAFMLIVGILIDCMVATKVVIPSMMAILGGANFWPRERPR